MGFIQKIVTSVGGPFTQNICGGPGLTKVLNKMPQPFIRTSLNQQDERSGLSVLVSGSRAVTPAGPEWGDSIVGVDSPYRVDVGDFGGTFPPTWGTTVTGSGLNLTFAAYIHDANFFNHANPEGYYYIDYNGPAAHCRLSLNCSMPALTGFSYTFGYTYLSGGYLIGCTGSGADVILPVIDGSNSAEFHIPAGPVRLKLSLHGVLGPNQPADLPFSVDNSAAFLFENLL